MTTIELVIRNGEERRTLNATGPNYAAAKADVDEQVPESWQRVAYRQR